MVEWEASLVLMPLLVGRVQAEKVLLVDGLETSQVSSVKVGGIFLLVLRSGLAGGSPRWQPLAGTGLALYPIQQILGSFLGLWFQQRGHLWNVSGRRGC